MTEVTKMKKAITASTIQITKAYNSIVRDRAVEKMTSEEVTVRLSSLRAYWQRFENAQSDLESTVEEEELEQLALSRSDTEELYIYTEVALKNKLSTVSTLSPQSTASNIAFVPFDEEESFTNFIRRFENFVSLKDISDDKTKRCTLLAVLPPRLHELLQNLISPEDPYKMDYDCVVKVLQNYLEPLPSIISLQHRFLCHTQQNESIIDFSMELKRLAKYCNFKCECGNSVSDMLLRMQFVRGLKDNDVRGQLLQKQTLNTFKETVQLATALESSRVESNMMLATPTTTAIVLKVTEVPDRSKAKQQVPKSLKRADNIKGQKVQARNYSSKEKWKLGQITRKVGNVMYKIKMDNGLVWTRHADQIISKK